MSADSPMRSEIYGPEVVAPAGEVVLVLRSVRRALAGGYSVVLCRENGPEGVKLSQHPKHMIAHSWDGGELRVHAAGPICSPWAEGVRFYDLFGAFQAFDPRWVPAQQVAEDLLRRLLDPDLRSDFYQLAEQHTLRGLLSQLDRAILRAHAVAR